MIQIDYYITIFILMTGGTDDVFEQVVVKIEIITSRRKKMLSENQYCLLRHQLPSSQKPSILEHRIKK